jgi:hypothetical protein
VDITASLVPNVASGISDRDVTLSGLLADGSPFDFELFSQNFSGRDYFHPDAFLSVTLVVPGDTNGDGVVDLHDLNSVRNQFGVAGPDDGTLAGDTFPFDGVVNIDDLNAVRNNFGSDPMALNVPEPASAGFAVLALLSSLLAPRRRAGGGFGWW